MSKPVEQWIRVGQDHVPAVGARIILHEQDIVGDDGEVIGAASAAPCVAEVVQIGAHWSCQPEGQAGYHVLCRRLPNGERLANEHYARLERKYRDA